MLEHLCKSDSIPSSNFKAFFLFKEQVTDELVILFWSFIRTKRLGTLKEDQQLRLLIPKCTSDGYLQQLLWPPALPCTLWQHCCRLRTWLLLCSWCLSGSTQQWQLAETRSRLEHLCPLAACTVSMHFKQNPRRTQSRMNRPSTSDVPIPRLMLWMSLQSRVRVNLPESPSQSVWQSPQPCPQQGPRPPWYSQVSNVGSRVSWRHSHQPGQPKSSLPLQPPYIEEENLVSGEGPWKPRPAGKSFWYLA